MNIRLYFRSLLSGYGMIAVGAVCSIITVPLALHYLSPAEYGLWAIVLQMGGYFALIDTGISSSIGRILIDHRRERPSHDYGAVFFGGLLILCGLAVLIVLIGLLVWPMLPDWLRIEEAYQSAFSILFGVQCLIVAASLLVRGIGQSLLSAARYDLLHLCIIASLVSTLLVLWLALRWDAGIYAFAWASAGGFFVAATSQAFLAWRCGCLPGKGEWALPAKGEWVPILAFARDVVFVQLGNALTFSTQTVLVGAMLGLTAAATWATGSKMFFLLVQCTGKIAEVAGPQMAGMFVAKEDKSLNRALQYVLTATAISSVVGALLLIFGNSTFIRIWTGGQIDWPGATNIYLGVWLVFASITSVLTNRALAGKQIKPIRSVYLLEGVFGVAASLWAIPRFGIPGMAAVFAISCFFFSFRATVWEFAHHQRIKTTDSMG